MDMHWSIVQSEWLSDENFVTGSDCVVFVMFELWGHSFVYLFVYE